jgi:hypothetical protein
MLVTKAQLRTLQLLQQQPASRIYRSGRPGDYTWGHQQAEMSITATLHKPLVSGHAQLQRGNKDVAILTGKGRSVLMEWDKEE